MCCGHPSQRGRTGRWQMILEYPTEASLRLVDPEADWRPFHTRLVAVPVASEGSLCRTPGGEVRTETCTQTRAGAYNYPARDETRNAPGFTVPRLNTKGGSRPSRCRRPANPLSLQTWRNRQCWWRYPVARHSWWPALSFARHESKPPEVFRVGCDGERSDHHLA